jgi:hypothetical protein
MLSNACMFVAGACFITALYDLFVHDRYVNGVCGITLCVANVAIGLMVK